MGLAQSIVASCPSSFPSSFVGLSLLLHALLLRCACVGFTDIGSARTSPRVAMSSRENKIKVTLLPAKEVTCVPAEEEVPLPAKEEVRLPAKVEVQMPAKEEVRLPTTVETTLPAKEEASETCPTVQETK